MSIARRLLSSTAVAVALLALPSAANAGTAKVGAGDSIFAGALPGGPGFFSYAAAGGPGTTRLRVERVSARKVTFERLAGDNRPLAVEGCPLLSATKAECEAPVGATLSVAVILGSGNDHIEVDGLPSNIFLGDGNDVARLHNGVSLSTIYSGDRTTGGTGSKNVASTGTGSTLVYGSDDDDVFAGNAASGDFVAADSGNDQVSLGPGGGAASGHDGNDTLGATTGSAIMEGGLGSDAITGGTGNDQLFSGLRFAAGYGATADRDNLIGGSGNDTLMGGAGMHWLSAGLGTDRIEAAYGQVDFQADCGPGTDEAVLDTADPATGCESITRK